MTTGSRHGRLCLLNYREGKQMEMITYTVTLHADGGITYSEPKPIEWKE